MSNCLEKQLNKAIEILSAARNDICPYNYGLINTDDCPPHFNCKTCWIKALESFE